MDTEGQKQAADYLEKQPEENGIAAAFDHAAERKLLRKIDWRLLPILGALYSISLIDRTNVRSSLADEYKRGIDAI